MLILKICVYSLNEHVLLIKIMAYVQIDIYIYAFLSDISVIVYVRAINLVSFYKRELSMFVCTLK